MPLGKRQRKVLLGFGIFLGIIILLIVSLPLWFPWVARPVASKQGAHYSRYERLSYNRFAVEGVGFTNEGVQFRARRVEGLTPSIWSWRIISPSAKEQHPFLNIEGWELDLLPSAKTNQASTSVYTNIQQAAEALRTVERLIPAATLSNGTLRIQSTALNVRNLRFEHGELRGQVEWPEGKQSATVTANFTNLPSWQAQIQSDTLHLQGTVDFTARTNAGIVQSTWLWWSNQIELSAQFGREGVLPESAVMRVQQFRVPAETVRLLGYQDITGSVDAKWEKGQFAVNVSAKATPLSAETNLPPVSVDLHSRGDTNAAVISSAIISSPWLRAELSKELTLHFNGQLLREPATMKLAADLSQQPWAKLEGKINGEADFSPGSGKFPAAQFTISGVDLGGYRIQAKTFTVKGGLNWPWLEVTNVNAVLDDGSTVEVAGKMDLEKQIIDGAKVHLKGKFAQRWLPDGYSYEDLSLNANAQGPLKQLAHNGELEIANLTSPQTRPLQLKVGWIGEQINLRRAEVTIAASNSTLAAVFSIATNQQPSLTNIAINLEKLSLQKAGNSALELEKPATILMGKGETNRWLLRVSDFNWRGPSGGIAMQSELDWPRAGDAHVTGDNLRSDLLDDFFNFHTEKFEIGKLDATAGWTNGPLTFRVEVAGSGVVGGGARAAPAETRQIRSPVIPERRLEETQPVVQLGGPVSLQMLVMGDQSGIAISNLVVNSETSAVAVAHGFLPATINPSATNMFQLAVEKPLNLEVMTKPQSVLWQKLRDLSGVVLRDPNLNVNLSGTWREPNGGVRAEAEEVQFPGTNKFIPKIEKLKMDLKLSPQVARISECKFLVQGQPVTLGGELPLEKSFWENLGKKKGA
jgi:hypothetical protein